MSASSAARTPPPSENQTQDPTPDPVRRRRLFVRFLGYVKPYTKYIVLAAIGGIVKFSVPLLVPKVIQHLIDNVFLNESTTAAQKIHEMWFLTFGLIGIFLFVFAPWTYVRHLYAGRAGHKAVFDLRCDLYQNILRMSMSFFDRNKSGSILSRLTSDVMLAQNLVGNALTNVWMDAAAIFVVLFFMFQLDVGCTFVALATMPFYLVFFKIFNKRLKHSTKRVQEETEIMSGNLQERLSGSIVVKAFAQEPNEDRRFLGDSDRLFSMNMTRIRWAGFNQAVIGTLTSIAPVIVVIYSGTQVIQNEMKVGELVALNMYLAPLYLPLRRFSELNVVFANAMAALERVFEFMDATPEISSDTTLPKIEKIEGAVEFENVSFAYQNEDGPVLRDVSFRARPGENVALVGPSGSGKSTLVSLLPRFYDVQSGAVRIDGRDVREVEIRSLRRCFGIVLQDPILFSGSIRENILYGRPKATEEELVEACRMANAWDFIEALPRKLDTTVGERGTLLSGGQKQRVTIARAFLTNPKILILDEATSSLDTESERLIQDALARLIEGRTTFTIAHRLSTIVHADRIVVMQDGRIIEIGTHEDLLENGKLYRHLYDQQFESAFQG